MNHNRQERIASYVWFDIFQPGIVSDSYWIIYTQRERERERERFKQTIAIDRFLKKNNLKLIFQNMSFINV